MNEKQIKERQDILIKSLHSCEQAKAAIREWLLTAPENIRLQLLLECKDIVLKEKEEFPGGPPFFKLLELVQKQDTASIAQFFIQEFGLMELHTALLSAMSDDLRTRSSGDPESTEGAD